jgi:uncharacterized protein
MTHPDLTHLALPGAVIAVRATPKAARDRIVVTEAGEIRVYVTTVPEDGKATEAVRRLLATALGVAPGRLTLVRGAAHRDKLFRLDQGFG